MTLRKQLYEWITGCPLSYARLGNSPLYQDLMMIDEDKLGIIRTPGDPDPLIPPQFLYRLPELSPKENVLLLMEGHDEDSYLNYEDRMREILDALRNQGWKVVLKPHPRVGSSPFLKEIVDVIIPDNVPSQFLGKDIFQVVISNISTGMGSFAREGVSAFSLEYLHQRKSQNDRAYYHSMLLGEDYATDPSHRINFPQSLSDLLTAIGRFKTVGL